jgi:uncharacterized protein YhdP
VVTRSVRVFLEVLGTLVVGLALIVGGAAWRLSLGPISLRFLNSYIEGALDGAGSGIKLKVDDTVLAWAGWERPLDLRAVGVHAFDAEGHSLMMLPEVSVSLSGRALLNGVIAPTSLTITDASLHLRRNTSGKFDLALGDEAAASGGPSLLPIVAHDLMERPDPARPISYLRRVNVSGAALFVEDSHWDTTWQARLPRLILDRDSTGLHARAALELRVGNTTSRFDVVALYNAASRSTNLGVRFEGVEPNLFSHAAPELAPLAHVAMPLGGTVVADLGVDGSVGKLRFDVRGSDGRLSLPELYPQDVAVKSLAFKGAVTDQGATVRLDEADLDLDGTTFTLAGSVGGLGGDMAVQLSIVGHAIKVDELDKRWPPSLAPNARRWIVANLSGGAINEIYASVEAHGNQADPATFALDRLAGNMRLSGIDVHYLGKMPKVVGTSGAARFDEKTLTIALEKGSAEGIAIDKGTVVIAGLDSHDQRIAIDLSLHGPLQAAMRILDADPLHYASSIRIDPAAVSGDLSETVNFKFPLIKDLRLAQLQVSATADLKNVTLGSAFMGQDLKDGNLSLTVDKAGMAITGTASLASVPVTLDWTEGFGPKADRRIRVAGKLDATARKILDVDAPEFLVGVVPAVLELKRIDSRSEQVDISLDLKAAHLALPRVNWHKPSGVSGKGHIVLTLAGSRLVAIDDFSVEAGDLVERGRASFDPSDGRFRSLEVTRLDFARNSLVGSLVRRPDGGFAVDFSGNALDATPFIKEQKEARAQPQQPSPKLTVTFAVKKLWLSDSVDLPFSNVKGTVDYDGERVVHASIDSGTVSGDPFHIEIAPGEGKRGLTVASDNAGDVLKAVAIADNVVGGKLKIIGTFDDTKPESPLTGVARITDFKELQAPLVLKLLTFASLTGIADQLSGNGVTFTSFTAPYTKTGDRIEFKDGSAVGSEIGITFEGWVDFGVDKVNINGTVVPVYTLNSLLGKIPLLGDILVGQKGSGIFAATYSASGTLSDPEVSVNPLAVLAPGILRSLLGGSSAGGDSSGAPQPPSDGANGNHR